MVSTEGKRDYMAVCERCHFCMDTDTYQAAEHLAHQVGGDQVHCPACGLRDWRFEDLAD